MTPLDPLMLAPAAFLAGVLMFLAPCTLPIVPGYLGFIAGVPAGASSADKKSARRRVVWNALAFIAGFSAVFILLGTFASVLGGIFGPWRGVLGQFAGVVIVLFGLTMLGIIRFRALAAERHMRIPHFITVGRWESSLFIGALFALGWSPCIGPILGTVLLFAGTSATALQGALLLGIFSLGLGLPFFITALLINRAGEVFARWGKVTHVLSTIGGVVLVLLGTLMLLGLMGYLVSFANTLFAFLGYDRLLNYL